MSSANLILLIVALIASKNALVESAAAPLDEGIIDKDILGNIDKQTLSDTDVNQIIDLVPATDKTFEQKYNKFTTRKDGIVAFIKAQADQAKQDKGYRALLLLLAAFETIKPEPADAEFATAEKDKMIDAILLIPVNNQDKTEIHKRLTTSARAYSPASGATAAYDMTDLLGAAHRLRLFLPDPIDAQTTDKGIRAIGRFNVLINELIPQTEDYEKYSLALAREIVTNKKASLFHYKTQKEKEVLLELDREYTWKKTLLDLKPTPPRTRTPPTVAADVTLMDDAHKQLQDEYKNLLLPAIKKTQDDFKETANSRKLAFSILSHSLKESDMKVAAVKEERKRMDDQLGTIPATDAAAEAKLAVEEAFLYAMLDATNYAADPNTPLQPAEKTKDREPAIHGAMNIRRLHLLKKNKEILENPTTKESAAIKVKDKTKELKDKEAAFLPTTTNDDDLKSAIAEAVKKIEDAAIQLFPPNPQPGPNPQPNPNPQPAPVPQQPQDPAVVKEALDTEFDNKPPPKVPANQCQDIGTNCGDIMRMCGIPAYVLRMHENCKRTCRACFPDGEPCQDQFPADCQMWKAEGYCTSRIPKALKMVQCPVTCELCPK